jgi:hypothetical protein
MQGELDSMCQLFHDASDLIIYPCRINSDIECHMNYTSFHAFPMVEDRDDSPTSLLLIMEPSLYLPVEMALLVGINFALQLADASATTHMPYIDMPRIVVTLLVKGLGFSLPLLMGHLMPLLATSPSLVCSDLTSRLVDTAPSIGSAILVALSSIKVSCTNYGYPIHFITLKQRPAFALACQVSTLKGHSSYDLVPQAVHAKPFPLMGGELASFIADVAPTTINIPPAAPSMAGDPNHGSGSYATLAHIIIHEACQFNICPA